jgi:DNA-binding cell septation regulator SpoVG
MQIEVIKLDKVDHQRIKGLATIKVENFGKIAGIKVIQGDNNLYCVPPNQSYKEDGLRRWMNIITFEQSLWRKIQEKILKRYKEIVNNETERAG